MHLRPIEHRNQRILTTQQIAEFYGATEKRISENFNRNKDRYTEGKHYFLLEGETLETFKTTTQFADQLGTTTPQFADQLISSRTPKLYLWTEKGALMHAKSLNTDKAWERYEELVDDYYRQGEQIQNLQTLLAQADVTITRLFEMQASHLDLTQISWECGRWHESYDQLQALVNRRGVFSPDRKEELVALLESIDKRVQTIEAGQTASLANYRETRGLLVGYLNAKQK